jgi:hypothetical protein
MDPLEQVKKLREEYERALDAAESRRAAYHEAVLDLHRTGTPLREIAKELGLSHQRVHQIVSGEPPRRSKLPRAAGVAGGVLLLLAAATFGALRLAHAAPFAPQPGFRRVVITRQMVAAFRGFGGITHPPGGAVLKEKRALVRRPTSVGDAAIWRAPDRVSAGHCSWLEIAGSVYGGSCYRDAPPGHGLSEVVPLVLQISGRTVPLLWGRVGANVARLSVTFQDGSHLGLRHSGGVFLYPVPQPRWREGHRPALLVARDSSGRVVGRRPLYGRTVVR